MLSVKYPELNITVALADSEASYGFWVAGKTFLVLDY